MSIAVIITDRNTDQLCQLLRNHLPAVNVQQWPNINEPQTVLLAVLWNHPAGVTNNMPKLQAVVSMGAGMDHIDSDQCIPEFVDKNRIVTLALKQNMAQYLLQQILHDYRHQQAYQQQQTLQQWQVLESEEDTIPTVGFLGLGELGGFVADRCADIGFNTLAWTRQQQHPSHTCYQGQAGLQYVCENSRYLVVLLPLNEQTHGIINAQSLAWCGADTVLINVGRGAHVDDQALLNALQSGQIKKAVLDVFDEEPLPAEHPFWSHPKIAITPHSSSRSDVTQTAQQIINYYQSL